MSHTQIIALVAFLQGLVVCRVLHEPSLFFTALAVVGLVVLNNVLS